MSRAHQRPMHATMRGWQNTWDLDDYACVASDCVADGGCDCVGGEQGVGGQGGADWGSCNDEQPGRVYAQQDGFAARP
jgi:hypothetical protein